MESPEVGQRVTHIWPGSSRRRSLREPTPGEGWQARLEANELEPLLYAPSSNYEAGVAIEHHKFGLGFVTQVRDKRACTVLFRAGTRKLVMNNQEISLGKEEAEFLTSCSVPMSDSKS